MQGPWAKGVTTTSKCASKCSVVVVRRQSLIIILLSPSNPTKVYFYLISLYVFRFVCPSHPPPPLSPFWMLLYVKLVVLYQAYSLSNEGTSSSLSSFHSNIWPAWHIKIRKMRFYNTQTHHVVLLINNGDNDRLFRSSHNIEHEYTTTSETNKWEINTYHGP